MQDLIIAGTGPHALEMADIVEQVNRMALTWRLLGFLPAPGAPAESGELCGYPVLRPEAVAADHPHARIALEYGVAPAVPRQRLATLVAPGTFVARTARLGLGCVLYPHGFVGANAVVGDHVFVLAGAIINHDDHVEDGATLCSGVVLAGHVHVGAGAYLGQGCTVRQDVRIGRGSLVGMGSVVLKDVPPDSVVVGNPARFLRPVGSA